MYYDLTNDDCASLNKYLLPCMSTIQCTTLMAQAAVCVCVCVCALCPACDAIWTIVVACPLVCLSLEQVLFLFFLRSKFLCGASGIRCLFGYSATDECVACVLSLNLQSLQRALTVVRSTVCVSCLFVGALYMDQSRQHCVTNTGHVLNTPALLPVSWTVYCGLCVCTTKF